MIYAMEPKSGPLVTVLIGTYNRPRYFAEAMRSIVRQTYRNLQIIAVNDGGPSVSEIVESFGDPRIVLINRKENRGLAYSLNQALEFAQGKYVAYLGDDDLLYPHHVQTLVDALEGPTDCQVAYSDLYKTHCRILPDGGREALGKVVNVSRDFDRFFLLYFNHVLHVAMMHRRDLLEKTGPYNEQVKVLIDWDMTRRLSLFTDFLHVYDITGEFCAPAGKSDRISWRMRQDGSEFLRNILAIRAARPAKPWPKMKDLSIILVPRRMDQAAGKLLSDIWLWTFVPFQVLLPLPPEELARLDSDMPNLITVPVAAASSPAARVDEAMKLCQGDYVALVPGDLPVGDVWVESAVHALMNSQTPMEGFRLGEEGGAWSALLRRGELLEARRARPELSVRQSVEAAGIVLRQPQATEMPFQFDSVLTDARSLEKEGGYLQAATIYEHMQRKLPNKLWMKRCQAQALYQAATQDAKALALANEINRLRPTVDSLLLEARLNRRADRLNEAVALLEEAQRILSWKG